MTHYAIQGARLQRLNGILLLQSIVPFVRFFSYRVCLVGLHPVVLGWRPLRS